MKRSITYREITVAIGILVAMVVALTLWMGLPGTEISGTNVHPGYELTASVRNFVINISTQLLQDLTTGHWTKAFGF